MTDIRISGTSGDIENSVWWFRKLEEKGFRVVLKESELYKNRGDNVIHRKYLTILWTQVN